MSYLEKLLDGEEVAWKPLGEVTQYEQPTKYLIKKKNYSNEFETPVLTAGKTFILGYTHETTGVYEASKTPVIIFDDFTTANKWVEFDFKVKSSAMKMITSIDDSKFLLKYVYYWLNTLPIELVDGDHKRQWISNFYNKRILIPCPENPKKSLAIQGEIVRILDAFSALTAELTAELTARKKQYKYYRDQLLTFSEDEVAWKPLGEVLVRTKGTQITAGKMKQLHKDEALLKVFAGGKTIAYVNFDDIPAKDINRNPSIIVKSRGNIEFEYYDKPFSHKNEMWSYHSNDDSIKIKYVYHILKLKEPYFQGLGSKMQMPQIATPDTDKFLIPIPCPENPKKSLAIQGEIVRILDTFDTLTSSLQEGLPREIALRKKQYAYYRDLLLNFSKPLQAKA